ncbi:hypothetical protein WJX74_007829 [Apatococcus lobatus]|uniref:Tubby C-terminal domain-containing protein n=1 Tax=Apatococcus lobatus TaxID=904363 RepID=A0AAW1QAA6_9CHLO
MLSARGSFKEGPMSERSMASPKRLDSRKGSRPLTPASQQALDQAVRVFQNDLFGEDNKHNDALAEFHHVVDLHERTPTSSGTPTGLSTAQSLRLSRASSLSSRPSTPIRSLTAREGRRMGSPRPGQAFLNTPTRPLTPLSQAAVTSPFSRPSTTPSPGPGFQRTSSLNASRDIGRLASMEASEGQSRSPRGPSRPTTAPDRQFARAPSENALPSGALTARGPQEGGRPSWMGPIDAWDISRGDPDSRRPSTAGFSELGMQVHPISRPGTSSGTKGSSADLDRKGSLYISSLYSADAARPDTGTGILHIDQENDSLLMGTGSDDQDDPRTILSLLEDDENKQPVMNSAALKRALKKELPGASPLPTARAGKPSKAAPAAISLEASSIWDYSHAENDAASGPAVTAGSGKSTVEVNSSSRDTLRDETSQQEASQRTTIHANPGADVLKLDDDDGRADSAKQSTASQPAAEPVMPETSAQPTKPTADELLVRLRQEQSKQQQNLKPPESKKPDGIADFLLLEDASGDEDEEDEALRPQPGLASPKYVTRDGRAVPPLSASLLEAAAAAERGQQSAAGQSSVPQTARGQGPDPPSRPYTADSALSSRPVTRGDGSSAGSRPMTPTQRMQQDMAASQRKRLQRLQGSMNRNTNGPGLLTPRMSRQDSLPSNPPSRPTTAPVLSEPEAADYKVISTPPPAYSAAAEMRATRSSTTASETHTSVDGDAIGIEPFSRPTTAASRNMPATLQAAIPSDQLREFVMRPALDNGRPWQCFIRRNRGTAKMFPRYTLFMEGSNQVLLAARRRKKSKSSNYVITLDAHSVGRRSPTFCGKVRSNFVGTGFTIYDTGAKPGSRASESGQPTRAELGMVSYQTNILGTRGPRKMSALIPALQDEREACLLQPRDPADSLLERAKREELPDNTIPMYNQPPRWNDQLGAYCLNFSGRVTQASVKNFQLVPEHEDRVLLQFGKVGRDMFTMDFQHPMSAFQAFAICLTSFDNKLACE